MEKIGRNDPCICGSGKKFKKCCERKMIGKRFMATKIDTQEPSAISSFFQKKITQVTHSELNRETSGTSKKINAQVKKSDGSSDKILKKNLPNNPPDKEDL